MALLKTGTRYPLAIVSSFTYKCSSIECEYCETGLEGNRAGGKCPSCGCDLKLISSHTETKSKQS